MILRNWTERLRLNLVDGSGKGSCLFVCMCVCVCLFVSVHFMHSLISHYKLRETTDVDGKGDGSLPSFLEQATCTVICRGLTWHSWFYLPLSSAKLRTASLLSLAWTAQQQRAVRQGGKVQSTLVAGLDDEVHPLLSVETPWSLWLQRNVTPVRHSSSVASLESNWTWDFQRCRPPADIVLKCVIKRGQ